MFILGIDPGSHCTGYGLVRFDQNIWSTIYLESGIWKAKRTDDFLSRAAFLGKKFSEFIAQHRVDVLVLEDGFSGPFPKAGLQLAQMRGIFLSEAFQKSLKIFEYAPKKVKLAVTGKGSSKKEQVSFMVQQHFGLKNNLIADESDALALCLTCVFNTFSPSTQLLAQKNCLILS